MLTPGLRAPSVPVGRSSMEPDKSWKERSDGVNDGANRKQTSEEGESLYFPNIGLSL